MPVLLQLWGPSSRKRTWAMLPACAASVRLVTGPVQFHSSRYVRPAKAAGNGSQGAGGATEARRTSTRPGGGAGDGGGRGTSCSVRARAGVPRLHPAKVTTIS